MAYRYLTFIKTALAIGSCFVFVSAVGQDATTFSGRILDAYNELPIENAELVHDSTVVATSDDNGYFEFYSTDIELNVQIRHIGYHGTYLFRQEFPYAEVLVVPTIVNLGATDCFAYANETPQKDVAGAITTLTASQINTGDGASLKQGLEYVPGVQFEERGTGGSRRINIRGSSYRSPFAVRNIKLYLDGIPLTSPDGSSPIELIEPNDMARVEVIKGPAGSLYGSGNGGVLLFQSKMSDEDGARVFAGQHTTLGSFGYTKVAAWGGMREAKAAIRASVVRQQTDGYRNQEANNKTHVTLYGRYTPGERVSYRLLGMYYDGYWELPGGINAEAWREDPTQARKFSEDINASVARERSLFGITQKWKIAGKLHNETAVYANWTKKANPYGTSAFFNGYKDEEATGYGLRSVFKYDNKLGENWSINAALGGEFQTERWEIREYEIENLDKGEAKYFNQTKNGAQLAFAQVRLSFAKWGTTVEIGSSLAQTSYLNKGFTYADPRIPLDVDINTGYQLLPRIAIGQPFGEHIFAHASISQGNSTPTVFDMVSVETGAFDTNLRPELGTNKEVGVRGSWWNGRVFLDISGYQMDITDAIVPKDDISFHNVGHLRQIGAEGLLSANLINRDSGLLRGLDYRVGYSSRTFTFEEYSVEDVNFKDNLVPGVPANSATQTLEVRLPGNIGLRASHYWFDNAALNDANTEWAPAYNLLHLHASYNVQWKLLHIGLNAGVNNVTDTSYSGFMMINAFGGRFFNPAPGRYFFGGIRLAVRIN